VQPDLLRRTKEVPKKATGGFRDIESERDSIEVHGKPAKTVIVQGVSKIREHKKPTLFTQQQTSHNK